MNQKLSAAVQSIMPPILWNAIQYLRGRPAGRFPWREFGSMATCANAKELLQGRFAELYAKYQPLDPFVPLDTTRYRHYNNCLFASLCRQIPGDFVCAGVSFGLAPRIVFDFTDFTTLGKTLHLVDPFEGVVSSGSDRISDRYNSDPDYVLRQYPPGAPIVLHRRRIPFRLPGKLAFVFSNTGDPIAEADSIPVFYEALSPGGILISDQYANNVHLYEPVLNRLGLASLWLPSGQGVIFKQ